MQAACGRQGRRARPYINAIMTKPSYGLARHGRSAYSGQASQAPGPEHAGRDHAEVIAQAAGYPSPRVAGSSPVRPTPDICADVSESAKSNA